MKKIYFLASMLMIGGVASAQYQTAQVMRADAASVNTEDTRPTSNQDRAPGDVISTYEDDCASSANWTLTNASSTGLDWTFDTNGPAIGAAFASTTAANGFAWIDTDAAGDGSSVDAQMMYSTMMDFTSNPAVAVQFESFYQEYQTSVFVEVSTNGAAGPWTQYEVHTNVTDNNATANPELTTVNISSQVGGQNNVAVRFNYQGGWGFFWQIDDFKIVEAYQNELEMTWSHFSSGVEGMEYYSVPTTQITEITFGGLIGSNGVTTQTSTYMEVEVDAGAEFSEVSGQTVDLAEGVVDTFSVESPNGWTPSGTGTFDLTIDAVTDNHTEELAGNNMDVYEPITVGNDIYARDNGISTGGFAGFVSTVGEPLQPGNLFEFFGTDLFGQVEIQLTTAAASEGQIMFASVYRYDGSDFVFETQSDDYTVEAGDLGSSVTLHLNDDVNVADGDLLLICAGHYGGNTPVSFAIAQPTIDGTVLAQSSGGLIQGADPSAMMVRAVMQPSEVSIDEQVAVTGMSVYPSPANVEATLVYNMTNAGNVELTVTDLSGKVISFENFGSQAAGAYKVNLNTTDFANGVYFYTLNVDGEKATKKFVVAHK
ncbi:MAG: T9SS type A sorting domain-containing protein [Crocinitomicaceae bacterium]